MATTPVTPSPVVNRIVAGHFREKRGYGVVRPRGTNDWLLIYTLRGAGEFRGGSDGGGAQSARITARPGVAVLIRPGTPHDYRVDAGATGWELLWAHFLPRPDWPAWLDWPAAAPGHAGLMRVAVERREGRRTVERALRKMNDLAVGTRPLGKAMAMNALEEALLWCAKQLHRKSGHDPRVEQAEEHLCQHLGDRVTLGDLADTVGLSVSRLSHLFKQQTGVTPQHYYEAQRLERARQLLELTNLPIKSIAAEVGFDNPFYFTLRFKRYAGTSPRNYRRDAQSGQDGTG